MGPLNQIVGMMPGMNSKMMKGLDLDDKKTFRDFSRLANNTRLMESNEYTEEKIKEIIKIINEKLRGNYKDNSNWI